MSNLWSSLSGRKTYTVCCAGIAYALYRHYAGGGLDMPDMVNDILIALGGMSARHAIGRRA